MPLILTLYFAASIPGCHRIPVMYWKGTFFEKRDLVVLREHEKRCQEAYPKSPCVKLMAKPFYRTYRAVCSGK
jgi:hypothetical protein